MSRKGLKLSLILLIAFFGFGFNAQDLLTQSYNYNTGEVEFNNTTKTQTDTPKKQNNTSDTNSSQIVESDTSEEDNDTDGRDEVKTEIVSLNLTGSEQDLEECLEGMPHYYIPGPKNNPEIDNWKEWEQAHRKLINNWIKKNCPELIDETKSESDEGQKPATDGTTDEKKDQDKEGEKTEKSETEERKKEKEKTEQDNKQKANQGPKGKCPPGLDRVDYEEAKRRGVENPGKKDKNNDDHICVGYGGSAVGDNTVKSKKKEKDGQSEAGEDTEGTSKDEKKKEKQDEEGEKKEGKPKKSDKGLEKKYGGALGVKIIPLCYNQDDEPSMKKKKEKAIEKILEQAGKKGNEKARQKVKQQIDQYWNKKSSDKAGRSIPVTLNGKRYIVNIFPCYEKDGAEKITQDKKEKNEQANGEESTKDKQGQDGSSDESSDSSKSGDSDEIDRDDKQRLRYHETGHAIISSMILSFFDCLEGNYGTRYCLSGWDKEKFEKKKKQVFRRAHEEYHQRVGKGINKSSDKSGPKTEARFINQAVQAVKHIINNGEVFGGLSLECLKECRENMDKQAVKIKKVLKQLLKNSKSGSSKSTSQKSIQQQDNYRYGLHRDCREEVAAKDIKDLDSLLSNCRITAKVKFDKQSYQEIGSNKIFGTEKINKIVDIKKSKQYSKPQIVLTKQKGNKKYALKVAEKNLKGDKKKIKFSVELLQGQSTPFQRVYVEIFPKPSENIVPASFSKTVLVPNEIAAFLVKKGEVKSYGAKMKILPERKPLGQQTIFGIDMIRGQENINLIKSPTPNFRDFQAVDQAANENTTGGVTKSQRQTNTTDCPLVPGQAYKTKASPSVYLVSRDIPGTNQDESCSLMPIRSPDVFYSYFSSYKEIKVVDKIPTDKMENLGFAPWGPNKSIKKQTLITTPFTDKVFVVGDDKLYRFESLKALQEHGFDKNSIRDVHPNLVKELKKKRKVEPITKNTNLIDGFLYKDDDSPKVYAIENGKKKPISNLNALRDYGRTYSHNITSIPATGRIDTIPIMSGGHRGGGYR